MYFCEVAPTGQLLGIRHQDYFDKPTDKIEIAAKKFGADQIGNKNPSGFIVLFDDTDDIDAETLRIAEVYSVMQAVKLEGVRDKTSTMSPERSPGARNDRD